MFQLIADSGSSKTDWRLLFEDEVLISLKSEGCNPYFLSGEAMHQLLAKKLVPKIKTKKVDRIHFYGSGCFAKEMKKQVSDVLKVFFADANINVETDMFGAARALLGDKEGFAAILGTGSNTCIYDGVKITKTMDSMGYILGDEGSGAHIGKLLLKEWLREGFPPKLELKFFKFCQLDRNQLLQRIYGEPNANRFLAGFAKFAKQNITDPKISSIIMDAFAELVLEVQQRFDLPQEYPMNFTGSIAYYFEEALTSVIEEWGQTMGKVQRSPIEGLVKFHQTHL